MQPVMYSTVRATRTFTTRFITRRSASTVSESAVNAASSAQAQASNGLSRVASSAGPVLAGAGQKLGSAAASLGNRASRAVAFTQELIPPTIYYSKVGLELSKQVLKGRHMYPPDTTTVQKVYEPIVHAIRNPASTFKSINNPENNPQHLINRLTSINAKQWASAGVILAEVLGFFTVGEMLGRLKLVGYHGHVEHHE